MSVDAMIRSIGVARDRPLLVFLGAGASMSSGMPSATQCIWEWKREIFLTNNPDVEKTQFSELSLPSVRLRIQAWLDRQRRYPALDHPDEYSAYIGECFARSDDRRIYFEKWVKRCSPHLGYQLLAELARQGLVASVWTTNFDALAARAATSINLTAIEIGIDSQQRLYRAPGDAELACVSLHGDYRYDPLKNTAPELIKQEKELRESLVQAMRTHTVLVCGYSGRDESVMAAFSDAYDAAHFKGHHPLFWTQYGDYPASGPVAGLLASPLDQEPAKFHVPGASFDDLMRRIALHVSDGEARERVLKILENFKTAPVNQKLPFALPSLPVTGLVKSNAIPLVPPGELIEFDLMRWPPSGEVWSTLREIGDRHGFVAAPFRGKVYALATIEQLTQAFADNVKDGAFNRVPLNDDDLRYEDGTANQLMRRATVLALAGKAGCANDGDAIVWDTSRSKSERLDGHAWTVYDAVLLQIRPLGARLSLVLKPTLRVTDSTGEAAPKEIERAIKVRVLGYQHNKEFNEATDFWRKRLLPSRDLLVRFPDLDGGMTFTISGRPIFAQLTDERTETVTLNDAQERSASQVGLQLAEPRLVFARTVGTGPATDTLPVRGLLQNRPFDANLTDLGIATNLRIAVIAPARDVRRVHEYLGQLHQPIDPTRWDADYLMRFPGFSSAFKCPLDIPQPGQAAFVTLDEPHDESPQSARTLAGRITAALSALRATENPSVTIIYIPARWHALRAFDLESEQFNLHDFVKAAAIPAGCSTQFLEESTLANGQQCRVRWWLSLAVYVKAMRTPWALTGLDKDSAFVGLGFSVRRKINGEGHVALGCSHLYSPNGHGLQFRLSKIDNPIMLRKNPFMSFDDARKLGEGIRELFFDAHLRLPNRVVVHKQTPFLKEEREGLQAGLEGVACVELLQIFVDDTLRYVASRPMPNGDFEIHGYPIRRGTTVVVDDQTALLWVHGTSTALNPRQSYFQGKRRIPAPLVMRRHAGTSDLMMLADEILGLSKMNFNSFDLYGQLPATIETSQRVARIGALLDRYTERSYDYRLFM
jgi:hypothetical protein